MRNRKPTVVDLFAGAGIFSYAFKKEDFNLVRAVELDLAASRTYQMNLGNHIVAGDVRSVTPSGTCDVLIGGPPCQGFSTLGKRQEMDPRNSLSLEMVRWARQLKPSIVVIENVPRFLDSKAWKTLSRDLERAKYDVSTVVLDACDMGAPQRRTRSFTFASKIGCVEVKRAVRQKIENVREAWKGLPSVPDGRNHHYAPEPSELALSRMKLIPKGGDKRDVMSQDPSLAPPSWFRIAKEATDVWGRMHWERPCNTLRTCLLNPSKGRYIHPEQNRVISLREAARLQTIPDDWKFYGPPTQVARQIGNSVPPYLGRAVARSVRRLLG